MSKNGPKGGEPIAIVGSACRFPGDATSPSKLWELLKQPRDILTEIPRSRFNPDAFYHTDSSHHGTSNVRHSYVLSDDHRLFDAQFFGIKPVEANAIDPQQRLLLETVYESLESAGLPMEKLQGSDTGVYVGLMTNDYADLLGRDIQNIPAYFASGTARSILSNRISYFFNWHGPSMTIDTACSSSLVAMHQAVQSLRAGETKIAVAAGTNLLLGPEQYVAESKLKMLSPTGRSRMWDKDADGYARGDGIAVVVLKPLSTALADGDHIECIIRETGTNQDGRTKGITMPNPHAQADLIRSTYSRAGLDITRTGDRPQYFEAHGTGTPAGDPVEAEAISTAFFGPQADYFRKSDGEPPLFVGSIKTVIGHTEGTAGLAAVLKASLALQHCVIPPNILLNELNPAVKPFYNDLRIIKKAQDWPKLPDDAVRRASVNSFGFGGANAHAILESFEDTNGSARADSTRPPFTPFNFSASSEKSLSATLARYSDYLKGQTHVDLRDLAWTLNCRRSTLPVRVTISASNTADLVAKLDDSAQSSADFTPGSKTKSVQQPKLLGIFTGQGTQWARMGAELLGSTLGAECIARLDYALQNLPRDHRPSWLLKDEILKDNTSSRIGQALFAQSLCTAIQIMLVDLLRAAGIVFTAVVGHSSGEISAAYAAGYLTAEDAIKIAYYRGWALQYSADINGAKGAMMVVGTSIEDARELCDMPTLEGRICVAASNSSASITLSGDLDAIEEAKEVFEDEKKFARLLKVDKAYHSHHMLPCAAPYIETLQNCRIRIQDRSNVSTTWVSSVYGKNIETFNDSLVDKYWSNNMVNPVLFSEATSYAIAALGPFDMALEVGPHPALKGPALQTIQEVSGNELPYTGTCNRGKDSRKAFSSALGALWMFLGENAVDFEKFDNSTLPGGPRRLVKGLPTYSWDHDRVYWHESRTSTAFRDGGEKFHSLLGVQCPDGTQKEIRWRNYLNTREIPWLSHHQVQGQIVFPAAGYISAAVELLIERYGVSSIKLIDLQDFIIGQALVLEENVGVEIIYALKISDAQKGSETVTADFNCYSDAKKGSSSMSLHASAKIKVLLGVPSHGDLPLSSEHQGSFLEIETDRFYNFVYDLGFGYTGPFHALSNMKRKMDHATGVIAVPIEDSTERPLLIHPGSLDGAIQAIMLAYSFPGDGRLRTLYLPTKIDSIRINPALALELAGPGSNLPFYSSVASARFSELSGDVDLYSSDGQYTVLQLQGLQTTPLTPLTAATDVPMFTEIQWVPEEATGGDFDVDVKFRDQTELLAMERVAHFYLKNLHLSIDESEISAVATHHSHLLSYASHCVSSVKSGKHPWVPSKCSDDVLADISQVISKSPESIDIKIMTLVGESLPSIVRGEINLLEILMQNNVLSQFYSEASGIQFYLQHISNICGQISNRYPHLNVLEIGAGSGETTEWILRGLNKGFSSYTYTDILDSQFDEAQYKFQEHQTKMAFKVLDIEKNIAEQGHGQESFDLVIASLALYATSNIEATLSNVRRLIKPGGYLLLLELTNPSVMRFGLILGGLPAWWMGHSEGRTLSPCISMEKWSDCMRNAGFSGSDVSISCPQGLPVPFSVMLTQAVDERVTLLRDPLAPNHETLGIESLTVIGGKSSFTTSLAFDVREAIGRHYGKIVLYPSLADLSLTDLRVMGSVLCFSDLDEPALVSMSRQELKAFKALFEKSKNILWVGCGAQGDNPAANMIVGVQRTLQVEMPHLRVQFMNLHSIQDTKSDFIAKKLLQLDATDIWEQKGQLQEILWYREPQITLRGGKFFIPRLKLHTERNERYNSSKRLIVKSVPRKSSVVVVDRSDGYYRVLKGKYPSSSLSHDRVQIQVTECLLRPVMLNKTVHLFLIAGKECETGADVVALSETLGSCIHVPTSWRVQCRTSKDEPFRSIVSLYSHFIAQSLFRNVLPGSSIAVLEPDFSLAAVLIQHAAQRGISLVLFTTENRFCSQPWVFIHRHSARRETMALIPPNVVRLLNFAGDQDVLSRLRDGLPDGCRLETERTLTMQYSNYSPSPTGLDEVGSQLQTLWLKVQIDQSPVNVNRLPTFTLASLINSQPSLGQQALLTWDNENLTLQVFPATSIVRFDQSKTYWLVGLTGGLGLSLCHWMARQGARYIALSSRNPKVDAAWIMQMAESGCTVRVFANDITNRESVMSTYNQIINTMPRIGGVAQGAMILQDTMFLDLDLPRLEKVLQPKIQGSIFLDELFSKDTLDFMIFFSSMAAITGNPGQVAYNAANMFMASLAAQRRNRGLAGYAINIGAIVGNGYVTRELNVDQQSYLYRVGHTWMSEQDFREVFAEGVLSCIERTGSSELCSSLRIDEDDSKNWVANPIFQHLVIKSNSFAVTNKKNKSGVLVRLQLLDATSHAEVLDILQDVFMIKLRSALQTDPDKDILDLSPDELGVDSLVAVDLRSWFIKEVSVDMPVLKIFNAASVRDLLDSAGSLLPDTLIPNVKNDEENLSKNPVVVLPRSPPIGSPKSESVQNTPISESSDDAKLFHLEYAPSHNIGSASSVTSARAGDSSSEQNDETSSFASSVQDIIDHDLGQKRKIQRTLPMSHGQSRFYFLRSFVEDQTAFNVTPVFELTGHLRIEDLARAVETVGQHHEALRTFFFLSQDKQGMQGVWNKSSLRLERFLISHEEEVETFKNRMRSYIFKIEDGETLRIQLLSLRGDKHWLICGFHHINMDGISFEIFWSDLEKAYKGLSLPYDMLQYPDFSLRQLRDHETGVWEGSLQYWREEFTDIPPVAPLLSFSRLPARPTVSGIGTHNAHMRLGKDLSDEIKRCAAMFQVTPYHFHLSVWQTLLFRLFDVQDICIGLGDGNRKDPDVMQSIGLFLNLVPIRFHQKPFQSFGEALKDTKSISQQAFSHAHIPLSVILSELSVPRSTAHSPLFQATFNYRPGVAESRKFCGCVASGSLLTTGGISYDLHLDVVDVGGGETSIYLLVQKDFYDLQHAEILLRSYHSLLQAFIQNPATRVFWPSLFSRDDVEKGLLVGRGFEMENPWPETLIHRINDVSASYPDHVALREPGGIELTYSQFSSRVCSIATELLQRGVHPGDAIGVFQSPGANWICSMMAIWHVGGTYVPLDKKSGTDRLLTIVSETAPCIILTDATTAQDVGRLQIPLKSLDVSCLRESPGIPAPNMAKATQLAIVMYTSGSTGVPKGVMVNHSAFSNQIHAFSQAWGIREGKEVVLHQSSYAWDMSICQILLSLSNAGTLIIADAQHRLSPAALASHIRSENVTTTVATPTEYFSWIRYGGLQLKESSWSLAVSGGEIVSIGLMQELQCLAKPELRLINAYGPAEATMACSSAEIPYMDIDIAAEDKSPGVYTLPNNSVYIVDEKLTPVPIGMPGELVIGGAGVAMGYLDADKNRERFMTDHHASAFFQGQGWTNIHRTGDRARLTEDGGLVLMGRISGDNQIKLNGIRINVEEIEAAILRAAKGRVLQAVVSPRSSTEDPNQNFMVAFVIAVDFETIDMQTKFLESLTQDLVLPQYMLPAAIIPIDALPQNTSGKVDRSAVKSLAIPKISRQGTKIKDLVPLEASLRQLWQETIPRELVSHHSIQSQSEYFHCGGSSLSLVTLQSLIRERLDVSVSLNQLFEASTLHDMASLVGEQSSANIGASIDWEIEIEELLASSRDTLPSLFNQKAPSRSNVVVLTGATGFIGTEILRNLLDDEKVQDIHCLAVRRPRAELPDSFSHPKVHVHHGNLGASQLGLLDSDAVSIFSRADVIIHNGADVSFMKTYQSLKLTNVASTKELARLALPRRIPFHFISSATVTRLASLPSFGESSLALYSPPAVPDDGYMAAKWVCEVYLERASTQFGLPVWIHRPSSVSGADAPELDLMSNIMRYSQEMRRIPDTKSWPGGFDLISVGTVAEQIVEAVHESGLTERSPDLRFIYESGELELGQEEVQEVMEAGTGEQFEVVSVAEWVDLAEKAGMSALLGMYLRKATDGQVLLPRLIKGER